MSEAPKDFFISYNSKDRVFAEWIAWTLEDAGYSTVIQAWDFRPGENFVLEMHRAATDTNQTIAVLSEDYLNAEYTQPEWAAALARDPAGFERTLLPIRVASCKPKGLLATRIYADLVGLSEEEARRTLLEAVQPRAKPNTAPVYPSSSAKIRESPASSVRASDSSSRVFPGRKSSAAAVWKEKLEFLRRHEAIASDAAQKFELKKQIEEAIAKIQELESETESRGSGSPRTKERVQTLHKRRPGESDDQRRYGFPRSIAVSIGILAIALVAALAVVSFWRTSTPCRIVDAAHGFPIHRSDAQITYTVPGAGSTEPIKANRDGTFLLPGKNSRINSVSGIDGYQYFVSDQDQITDRDGYRHVKLRRDDGFIKWLVSGVKNNDRHERLAIESNFQTELTRSINGTSEFYVRNETDDAIEIIVWKWSSPDPAADDKFWTEPIRCPPAGITTPVWTDIDLPGYFFIYGTAFGKPLTLIEEGNLNATFKPTLVLTSVAIEQNGITIDGHWQN